MVGELLERVNYICKARGRGVLLEKSRNDSFFYVYSDVSTFHHQLIGHVFGSHVAGPMRLSNDCRVV